MAYELKYRAETNTTRGGKAIKVDILEDDAHPISSITNSGVSGYDTFTTSGTRITSAIWDGSGSPVVAESDSFAMVANHTYVVSFTLTLNSGQAPTLDFTGVTVDSVQSASGVNSLEFTPTTSFATATLSIYNDAATNFSTTGAIYIHKKATFGNPPVIISQASQDNPFEGGIIGSEATITLVSKTNFQFEEFFYATNREYHVEIDFDGTNVWNGYVVPDNYREPYIDPPYNVTLNALDGIGDLRNIPYEETGELDIRNFIEDVVAELNVAYDFIDYVLNSTTGFEETAATWSDAGNVTFSKDRFVSESLAGYSTFYDVLDAVCKTFDARFLMDRGYWRWYRPAGQRSTSHAYTHWAKGAGSSTGTEDHKRNITQPNVASVNCFVDGSQQINILSAFREFVLTHSYDYRNLVWKDFSFDYSDITTYWEGLNAFSLSSTNRVGREMQFVKNQLIGYSYFIDQLNEYIAGGYRVTPNYATETGKIISYAIHKYQPGEYCIDMGSGDSTPADILSDPCVHYKETFTIQNTADANYAVSVKWDQRVEFATDAQTSLYVRAYNASWDRWLKWNTSWDVGPCAIQFDVDNTLQWATYECLSVEMDTSYEVTIHVYLSTAYTAAGSVSGTWFDNIELNIVRTETDSMPVKNELTETINTDYNLYNKFATRLIGDIDEQGYEDTIYKGYLKVYTTLPADTLSKEWQVNGSRDQDLLTHSRDMHKCMREAPLQKLVGTLYGENNFMTVHTDTRQSKDFFTNYATWDLQEMTWQGEFVELPDAAIETTNLITSWANDVTDPWDTFTSTGAVIDSAIETTGNDSIGNSNSISFDEGEQFYLSYSLTKNSGTFVTFLFAGDTHTTTGSPGTATLTATSTSSGSLQIGLYAPDVANYGTCTIYLYRKYGW